MEGHWAENIENAQLGEHEASYSQYGEDLIADYIFNKIGTTNNFLVDIGAGGAGRNLSNSHFFLIRGWDGLCFDMDGTEGTIKEFIKPDNIVVLLKKHKCPTDYDFLSLDIDSFDYDVLESILKHYTPRLICVEFNGTLDPLLKVKLKYEDGYTWDGTNKYGFSLGAGIDLLQKSGYRAVLNHKETNIFAVRADLLPDGFVKKVNGIKTMYHRFNPNAEWVKI